MNRFRQGRWPVRAAVALWIILAVVVWNVTFDRLIVEAGRAFVRAARASAGTGSYLRAGDWMHAAVVHGMWVASTLSLAVLTVGMVAIRIAMRQTRIPNS